MVDRGEAATTEEAIGVLMKLARGARAANHPLGATGCAMESGVASALGGGKYTRYPGGIWRADSQKWRVRFLYEGKGYTLGSYESEEEAARAHDDFVRANGLNRPLHFPARPGEVSSGVFRERLGQLKGVRLLRNMVDRGEAATMEEARRLLIKRARD